MPTQTKVTPGFGCCIYCRQKAREGETGLSKEHVIPFGLSGKHVIAAASCVGCARTINRYETKIMRGALLPLRLLTKMKSRKKTRPAGFNGVMTTNGVSKDVFVSIEELPWIATPYELMIPRFYLNASPNPSKNMYFKLKTLQNTEVIARLRDQSKNGQDLSFTARVDMDVSAFCRMIAKIAYCAVVAEYGLTAFDPWILPTVLDQFTDCNYFVGSPINIVFIQHMLSTVEDKLDDHLTIISEIGFGNQYLITCCVGLFPQQGFPIYEVIVGAFRDTKFAKAKGLRALSAAGSP